MSDDLSSLVWVLIAVVPLGVLAYFLYNLAKPTVTRKARVIGKRKRSGVSTAKCTFEFEDGSREEYDVSLDTYASLTEGDVGELSTRGLVFWGFRREGDQSPPGPPTSASISEESMAQIKEALFQGRKIEAIRLYRECTGSGLGEAKPAVERLERELRAAEPERFTGPTGD
jgi:hypothetical protein